MNSLKNLYSTNPNVSTINLKNSGINDLDQIFTQLEKFTNLQEVHIFKLLVGFIMQ